jgi:hypothetical protein
MNALPSKANCSKLGWIWPAAFLIFGFVCITLHQSDYLTAVPGNLGDARFNNIILEHLFRWVTGKDDSLWSPGFFYPYPGALTFSDNHFGTGWAYILARFFGLGPERAFIAWYSLAAPLNYFSCYYSLRKSGISQVGSAVGAFLFSFALNVSARHGHAQLAYRFGIPLAMLSWQRFLERGELKQASFIALWLTLQFLCSIYLGYFLLLLLIAYAIVQTIIATPTGMLKPRTAVLRAASGLKLAESTGYTALIIICCAALFGLFYPYLHYSRLYQISRSYQEIASMLPRPASYFMADGSRLWHWTSSYAPDLPMRWEHQIFFGLSAYLLMIVALIAAPSPRNKAAITAFLGLVIVTLYVHGHSLYVLIYRLPLANAIRAMGRIGLVMLFPVSILAGAGMDWLIAPGRRQWLKKTVAVFVTILMLVECSSYVSEWMPLKDLDQRLAALTAKAPRVIAPDAILYLPQSNSPALYYISELDGMRLAQELNRVTLNGYSGSTPKDFNDPGVTPCDVVNERLANYAAFAGIGYEQYASLVRRVVVIGEDQRCNPAASLAVRSHFRGRLPESLFKHITLKTTDMNMAGGKILIRLDVKNQSNLLLPSISDDDKQVRFSWRFVPQGTQLGPFDGWTTRKDINTDVPAGKDRSFKIIADPPSAPGTYRLEVSMVQESVAWFHHYGMPIAMGAQIVRVSASGAVDLSDAPP